MGLARGLLSYPGLVCMQPGKSQPTLMTLVYFKMTNIQPFRDFVRIMEIIYGVEYISSCHLKKTIHSFSPVNAQLHNILSLPFAPSSLPAYFPTSQ